MAASGLAPGARPTPEQRLQLFSELTRELARSTGDEQRLVELVARRLAEPLGDTCLIQMLSPDGTHFLPEGLHHVDPARASEWRELLTLDPQRFDEGITGRVLTTCKPILVAAITPARLEPASPRYEAMFRRLAITSVIAVPLLADDQAMGVALMGRSDVRNPYTDEDLQLLEDLASHASIAITNSRLLAAARRELADRKLAEAERDRTETRERETRAENAQMHAAVRAKSEFLANMSHELRTPLNAIIGFSTLLHAGKAGPVSAVQFEYLDEILSGSRRLLEMINDILDLARVESGRMRVRVEPVDLVEIATQVRDVLVALARERRIEIVIEPCPAVSMVVVDPQIVTQVLYNYVSNAIKFSPEGATVTIRTLEAGPLAFRLEVEDTGIGIAAADLGRLFVEFQQLDSGAAKHYQGTGLGLAVTRRIVELHGGTVDVRSTPGVGSTFAAVLPRASTSRLARSTPSLLGANR